MNWIFLSVLSAVFFTLMNLIQRKLAIDTKYPRALAFLFNLAAISFSVIYFVGTGLYKNVVLPTDYRAWILVAIACLFYGLYERIRFIAAKALNASSLSIVSTVSMVVAFTGALFLYSETLTLAKGFGSLLILLSLILVTYNKRVKLGSLKNVGIGILAFTILGVGWMMDKNGAVYFSAEVYSMFVWILPIVFIIFPKIKLSEIKYEFKYASWKILIPAFLNVVAYLLQLKAMESGDATQVIPIVQTSVLLTVLTGIIFLGEKEAIFKKIFAGILALIGSYLLIGTV